MKTIEEYYEYLQLVSHDLNSSIGDDESEFNKGRKYVMDRLLLDLKSWIDLNKLEYEVVQKDDRLEFKDIVKEVESNNIIQASYSNNDKVLIDDLYNKIDDIIESGVKLYGGNYN